MEYKGEMNGDRTLLTGLIRSRMIRAGDILV